MRRLKWTIAALAALASASGASLRAQPQSSDSPREQVSRGFAEAPDIGEALPDVAAYDGDGQPFRLSSLQGSHTVLVFGCLT